MLNTSRLAAGLFGLLLFLLPARAFPATMPAIRMKIVDSQDGSPVAGANVLFLGTAHEGLAAEAPISSRRNDDG